MTFHCSIDLCVSIYAHKPLFHALFFYCNVEMLHYVIDLQHCYANANTQRHFQSNAIFFHLLSLVRLSGMDLCADLTMENIVVKDTA